MAVPKDQWKDEGCAFVNNQQVGDNNSSHEQVGNTSIYRRQSTSSFTAHTTGNDNTHALALISDMLATYNDMIEKNTNAINENAAIQETDFAAMRSTLESIIDAINGITLRTLNLEIATRQNTEALTALDEGMNAGTNVAALGHLKDFHCRVEKIEHDVLEVKDSQESTNGSFDIIERRLASLESRISNIENFLMKLRKHDFAAKMA